MSDMTEGSNEHAPVSADSFRTEGSTTQHSMKLNDQDISYRAIAEWVTLRKIHKPVAEMFHTAYLVDTPDGEDRPLTFVFNGGPGAASAFLHMGALGPQRVEFGANGTLPKPPTKVVDNLETWLAFTDLVFIDPIGTGFSRAIQEEKSNRDSDPSPNADTPAGPQENPDYWEINVDLDSLGEFICRFLSEHHRWTSPLFIAGESYGGFRVAKMARSLQETHGVGLCGALLISPAIEFDGLFGTDYNLTYWTEVFPSLVAAAIHHGKSINNLDGRSRQDVIAEAESYAANELTRWLAQGDGLAEEERVRIATRVAELTGMPQSVVDRAEGRVNASMFCRELLRDQRRVCGLYDASVSTVDPYPDRNQFEGPDPTLFSIDRLFTGAINHQLRTRLQVDSELDYRLLSMQVNEKWKEKTADHIFRKLVGAMDDLRYGMSLNSHMQVFISHGYFDLVTPYFASRRLVRLMKHSDEQKGNLVTKNYNGGHMFYTWDESRKAFHNDAQEFYNRPL